MEKMKTAVIGCGKISDIYFQNMINKFDILDVVCCAATKLEHAEVKAKQYGTLAREVDDIMSDKSIELIVNLTPTDAHYKIIKKALLAGKHVFTEKPLARNLEEAKELLELADERQLLLGCAPETFLGGAVQAAKKLIQSGEMGTITGCQASLNLNVDLMYPIFRSLTRQGAGIGMDRGIYFLTTLCYLLGPISEVCGFIRTLEPKRTIPSSKDPRKEEIIEIQNENQMTATVRFHNGALGTLNFNGNTIFPEVSNIMIYGKKGILMLPNPNEFGGKVQLLESGFFGQEPKYREIEYMSKYISDSRGIGAAELASAVRKDQTNRTRKEMAYHVIEVFEAIAKSSMEGKFIGIKSSFFIPEAFDKLDE
jgi:predicted dehydrogenase